MTLPYTHLTLAECHDIYRLHSAQIPVAVITQRRDRYPSTIYREISRNSLRLDSSQSQNDLFGLTRRLLPQWILLAHAPQRRHHE
jgi:IS30 family transposase